MREELRDQLRLLHISEACQRLSAYVTQGDFTDFDGKSLTYFGLVKNLEIIGEAAYMLSLSFKDAHTETSWNDIVRMRHLMVHGYYNINPAVVREIILKDVPVLQGQIQSYLSELGCTDF